MQKQISLNKIKSRIPGILYYVGEENIVNECEKNSNTNGNYGKIVGDIEIPIEFIDSIKDFTDTDINIPVLINGEYTGEFYSLQPLTDEYLDYMEKYHSGELFFYKTLERVDDYPTAITTNEIEMEFIYDSNNNLHKYLRYDTLRKWFIFFQNYYKELTMDKCSNNTTETFTSYQDRWGKYPDIFSEPTDDMLRDDALAEIRGGKAFYDWMSDKCFKKFKTPVGTTMPEYLYYPEVLRELAWFEERNYKYSGYTYSKECSSLEEDCCDCTEYVNKGGINTYNWLKTLSAERYSGSTKTACVNIPLLVTNDIHNIGNFSMYAPSFDKDDGYTPNISGNSLYTTVMYENGVDYLNTANGSGYNYSNVYKEKMFGGLDPNNYVEDKGYAKLDKDSPLNQWKDSMDLYIEENNIVDGNLVYTGITDSKLINLIDSVTAYDDMMTELPGSFKTDVSGFTIVPGTDECLDLKYHIGNVYGLTNRDEEYEYYGGIISGIKISRKDVNGVTILEKNVNVVDFDYDTEIFYPTGSGVIPSTQETIIFNDPNGEYYTTLNGEKVFMKNIADIEIEYYINTAIKYNPTGSTKYMVDSSRQNIDCQIKYVDKYTMSRLATTYYDNSTMSHRIYYYNLTPDEQIESDGTTVTATHYTVTEHIYANLKNNVYAPVFRREINLGSSTKEKESVDIYIDRGVNSAFQKHLRVGEVTCLNDLEEIGNGYFNILKNN